MHCPACQSALTPKVFGCDNCGVEVRGSFPLNEFATLEGDDLLLLRIFVLAEGRIRDMEAPLGLSYPTIRTRLAALRAKLAPDPSATARNSVPARGAPPETAAIDDTLDRLSSGALSFDDALDAIRKSRGKRSPKDKP